MTWKRFGQAFMVVMTSIGEAVRASNEGRVHYHSRFEGIHVLCCCFCACPFKKYLLMRMTHCLKMLEVGEMVSACDLQLVDWLIHVF